MYVFYDFSKPISCTTPVVLKDTLSLFIQILGGNKAYVLKEQSVLQQQLQLLIVPAKVTKGAPQGIN